MGRGRRSELASFTWTWL